MVQDTFKNEMLKSMDPEKLSELLLKEYLHPMPADIETIEDMTSASMQMATIVGYLQYLQPQYTLLKIYAQNLKAGGDKDEYRLMMQRRDVLECVCDLLKTQRDTISRMLTIKQEINREMKLV